LSLFFEHFRQEKPASTQPEAFKRTKS